MHLHTIIAVLAPGIITVQAGCYSGGPTWYPDQGTANEFVYSICKSRGISGFFNQGQTKYRCRQMGSDKKFEFWVQWKGPGGLTLHNQDCNMRLKNEINGCGNGGESTIADWYFR
jgi:hypothetical protein